MVKYGILLWGLGLLLLPRSAAAQVTVSGPTTPTAHALTAWFQQHVPVKFQARDKVEVQTLSEDAMEDYLHADPESDAQSSDGSTGSEDDIDGVFEDDPPKIILRVSDAGMIDYSTLAHEYGHYVWFDLLSASDRKRYKAVYEHQKSAHRLVSDYAAESVEEGFAEAFSADSVAPMTLLHQDPLSYQFLSRWQKAQ